ncbi:ogr/Delta-like zinc finger family protein [Shewanella sp. D64]|uniref:ogr/Delta-like zinc finger family protein n=1 Tax=unclassified Shewanella TaxID=196818 RepID=UPI0022BA134D|nr:MULTISPECIES: ogr/Delta-like zinc finger family protein [unclassified Shewanella]MEC4728932.1 ogr/Delta-like zinc finger family protein [Shewanella sp. D64]MEC4740865.1 ogr/Delta-like zinc finger family protein [Shewanella sp. E94]WBJ96706.1 ogr/Delta-like zinc finger family protein [Shewanella sp. MTB7]
MARKSMIECPKCLSGGRIATSKKLAVGMREMYCQCLNLNCSEVFILHLTFSHYAKRVGSKPDPELQPELCKIEVQAPIIKHKAPTPAMNFIPLTKR